MLSQNPDACENSYMSLTPLPAALKPLDTKY